ncbi:MAG TPA: hypothetical protein VF787_00195, partial [Thermoanaerobaculia bacterium]
FALVYRGVPYGLFALTTRQAHATFTHIFSSGTRVAVREGRSLDHMVDRTEIKTTEAVAQQVTEKKPFVAPQISAPVDVLEATTFFQSVESGATN